jgi:hypothetical protein
MIVGLILSVTAYCEDTHHHEHHDTGGIELGFSFGYVYFDENGEAHGDNGLHEEEGHPEGEDDSDEGLALHVHVGKRLGEEGLLAHVSLGIGAEVILADHEHYALMAFASVYPWRGLVLSVGPGVEWAEHEGEWASEYSTHLEAAYVFEMGEWHLGPMVDFSKTDDGEHYTVGLHVGIHL